MSWAVLFVASGVVMIAALAVGVALASGFIWAHRTLSARLRDAGEPPRPKRRRRLTEDCCWCMCATRMLR